MKKTYRYFVSFSYPNGFADCICVYDEPLDTPDMINRCRRDIASMQDISNPNEVVITFFKRIKDNR
ncbi:MAG: hypothetical protein KBT03_08090 [Bacteroidales bacterium]|nr:hypothetical protein [Candidatus Scybalousia scybalohippi]